MVDKQICTTARFAHASLYYWRSKLRAMRAEPASKFLTVEMEPARPPAGGNILIPVLKHFIRGFYSQLELMSLSDANTD